MKEWLYFQSRQIPECAKMPCYLNLLSLRLNIEEILPFYTAEACGSGSADKKNHSQLS